MGRIYEIQAVHHMASLLFCLNLINLSECVATRRLAVKKGQTVSNLQKNIRLVAGLCIYWSNKHELKHNVDLAFAYENW